MPHFPPPPPPPRATASARARAAVAACSTVLLALAAGACNEPLRLEAQLEVAADTLVARALSGTAPSAASALMLRNTPGVVSPTRVSDFDLAVDINAAGEPVLYPAALVTSLAQRRVGLRRVEQRFDSVTRAPGGDYVSDSAITVRIGQAVGVQVPALGNECLYSARPYYYSKVVVDSVRLAGRLVFLRSTTNPNCGFRSFAPGIPKD